MKTDHQYLDETIAIVEKIKPQLAGHDPTMQGAVLAFLVAMYVAGHTPEFRAETMTGLNRLIEQFVPLAEFMLFGPDGHPHKDFDNADASD